MVLLEGRFCSLRKLMITSAPSQSSVSCSGSTYHFASAISSVLSKTHVPSPPVLAGNTSVIWPRSGVYCKDSYWPSAAERGSPFASVTACYDSRHFLSGVCRVCSSLPDACGFGTPASRYSGRLEKRPSISLPHQLDFFWSEDCLQVHPLSIGPTSPLADTPPFVTRWQNLSCCLVGTICWEWSRAPPVPGPHGCAPAAAKLPLYSTSPAAILKSHGMLAHARSVLWFA